MKRIGSIGRIATVATGVALGAIVVEAVAQDVRYVGRAVREIQPDGTSLDDARAGTGAEQVPCTPPLASENAFCDIAAAFCFDVTCGSSTTVGGAFDEADAPRPGFPRVESAASGSASTIGPLVQFVSGATTALADGETGELTTTCSCAAVSILGFPLDECPEGEGLPLPFSLLGVSGTITPCKRDITIEDGLSMVRIAGAVIDEDGGGRTILSQSSAGIEIAYTSGGGGCSATSRERPSEPVLVAMLLAVLAFAARRRRS